MLTLFLVGIVNIAIAAFFYDPTVAVISRDTVFLVGYMWLGFSILASIIKEK